jgi:hypothetical protein
MKKWNKILNQHKITRKARNREQASKIQTAIALNANGPKCSIPRDF